jgi:hypothetical protein
MVFGCYALFTIGSELFSYRDCDSAADELKGVRCCPNTLGPPPHKLNIFAANQGDPGRPEVPKL